MRAFGRAHASPGPRPGLTHALSRSSSITPIEGYEIVIPRTVLWAVAGRLFRQRTKIVRARGISIAALPQVLFDSISDTIPDTASEDVSEGGAAPRALRVPAAVILPLF